MPHILVNGTDITRSIQYINIHAEVRFSYEMWRSKNADTKMEELIAKIESLVSDYFEEIESNVLSNH